ncbi:hypothetical protein L1987_38416 [Smallanthus sonchifolius]|uniref:Uncharacterized protein n=1 Tax=Smallanthus sonchifolius TaxID=185202 RepID=A0ACB9HIK3_9ASTR|nr:hypothetical protein L1987_38416 [Smallanthus sonchifolius]
MKASPSPSHINKNPRERTRSINNVTQRSSKNVVVRYKQDERKSIRKTLTLKECLLASPNNDHHHAINPSKIQVYTSDLTTEARTEDLCASRISFPPEKLNGKRGKVDEDEDEESSFDHMLDRCESQKTKKKVSFRFPEEADIFIFCSEE